jgi:hypothetical protein
MLCLCAGLMSPGQEAWLCTWEDRQRAERERINAKQRGTPSAATGNETAALRYMRRG